MRQKGGVSVHPPAISILTGERPHTIWSVATLLDIEDRVGMLMPLAFEVFTMPSLSRPKALSLSPRNMASFILVSKGAESGRGFGIAMPLALNSLAASLRSS